MIELMAFNLLHRKESMVFVGIITDITDIKDYQIIILTYKNKQNAITKKQLKINIKQLGLPITPGDIILWDSRNIYYVYNSLLIPIKSTKKISYKIETVTMKKILLEQQELLNHTKTLANELTR